MVRIVRLTIIGPLPLPPFLSHSSLPHINQTLSSSPPPWQAVCPNHDRVGPFSDASLKALPAPLFPSLTIFCYIILFCDLHGIHPYPKCPVYVFTFLSSPFRLGAFWAQAFPVCLSIAYVRSLPLCLAHSRCSAIICLVNESIRLPSSPPTFPVLSCPPLPSSRGMNTCRAPARCGP